METEAQEKEEVRAAAMGAVAQIEENEEVPTQEVPIEEVPDQAFAEKKLELVDCPRCGHHLENREVIHPGEDEVKEYFRCLMSGKPFTKTYQLFNGELTTTYALLTGDEAEVLSAALKTVNEEDFITYASKAIRIKLLFYLRRWCDENFEAPATASAEALDELWRARYGSRGEDVPVLMIKVMLEFIRLTEMLPMAGLDEVFYKGAGLS